jgi:hypothetical protein
MVIFAVRFGSIQGLKLKVTRRPHKIQSKVKLADFKKVKKMR